MISLELTLKKKKTKKMKNMTMRRKKKNRMKPRKTMMQMLLPRKCKCSNQLKELNSHNMMNMVCRKMMGLTINSSL